MKDTMERAKLKSELDNLQRLVDRIPPDILAELKRGPAEQERRGNRYEAEIFTFSTMRIDEKMNMEDTGWQKRKRYFDTLTGQVILRERHAVFCMWEKPYQKSPNTSPQAGSDRRSDCRCGPAYRRKSRFNDDSPSLITRPRL